MARMILALAPILDAVIHGASWFMGEGNSLVSTVFFSVVSLFLMTLLKIGADALDLPDVMPLELAVAPQPKGTIQA